MQVGSYYHYSSRKWIERPLVVSNFQPHEVHKQLNDVCHIHITVYRNELWLYTQLHASMILTTSRAWAIMTKESRCQHASGGRETNIQQIMALAVGGTAALCPSPAMGSYRLQYPMNSTKQCFHAYSKFCRPHPLCWIWKMTWSPNHILLQ